MIRILSLATFLLLLGFAFPKASKEQGSNPFEYKWLNKQFPIDTLISYENDTLVLSESPRNHVVHFWFTSCPPCIAEIKWLNKLKEQYQGPGLEFIAVSFESKKRLSNFLETHDFNFKQYYLDQQRINENYLTIGYPTTLVLDKTGKVIFQKSGGHDDPEKAVEIYQLISNEIEKHQLNKLDTN